MKTLHLKGSTYLLKVLCLTLALGTIACTEDKLEDIKDPPTDETQRALCLGDSYTIGQGVSPADSWPEQLRSRLDSTTTALDSLLVIASTGWTTANLLNALDGNTYQDFDLVTLQIGVNDQYQSRDFADFQTDFNQLLADAQSYADSPDHVLVLSIPDYGVTPFGSADSLNIANELNAYNAFIAMRCEATGLPFIDITTISRELGDGAGALASDQLHPSGEQYALWVEEILETVTVVLGE